MSDNFVQILGCSSATPTSTRHPTSQYLVINGEHILIDCGEGTQMQMLKYHIKPSRISTILISHLHGDHYFGLIGLLSTMSLQRREHKITIIGPPALKEILDLQIKHGGNPLNFPIEFIANHATSEEIILEKSNIQVQTLPLQHRIPCWGYRIESVHTKRKVNVRACEENKVPIAFYERIKDGADYVSLQGVKVDNSVLSYPPKDPISYAFISDTLYDTSISSFVKNCTLLYHESTFLHEMYKRAKETYHSTALEAGKIASKAEASQLIIGHFSARYSDLEPLLIEAKTTFDNTLLAEEGKVFII